MAVNLPSRSIPISNWLASADGKVHGDSPSGSVGGGGGGAGTGWLGYAGIPDPTVANATLAARGFTRWVNYNPITIPTPSWQSGDIYVNPQTGTDSSNPTGSPGSPRATIPSGVKTAGTKIFLAGTHGNISFSGLLPGTDASPIWIIGVSGNSIPNINLQNCTHVIVDGIDMSGYTGGAIGLGSISSSGDTNHITIRNCDVSDRRWPGGNTVGIGGTPANGATMTHVIVYNCNCDEAGYRNPDGSLADWETGDKDFHAVDVSTFGRDMTSGFEVSFWWVINNSFTNCAGNGFQATGQNFTGTAQQCHAAFHDFYVAGNYGQCGREALVWTKAAKYVVFSRNRAWGARNHFNQPGTGMGWQYGVDQVWFIDNEIYDCDWGIRCAGDTGEEPYLGNRYIIGNLIYNIKDFDTPGSAETQSEGGAIAIYALCLDTVWNNTLYDVRIGVNTRNGVAGNNISIVNNIFHTYRNNAGGTDTRTSMMRLDHGSASNIEIENNVLYDAANGPHIFVNGTTYTSLAAINGLAYATGNDDANPNLTNPNNTYGSNNFTPGVGSNAEDGGISGGGSVLSRDPFADFLAEFGLNIDADILGNDRTINAIDIGAIERQ